MYALNAQLLQVFGYARGARYLNNEICGRIATAHDHETDELVQRSCPADLLVQRRVSIIL
jgi:hypothetical protein